MIFIRTICSVLLVAIFLSAAQCRSYNNGLIFYNLENHNTYLPPTISVSRGRGLAKFKYSTRGSIWSTFGKPCDCEGSLCGCCVGITVKQYNFDQKMCANVSYALPKDEIQLEVFLNNTSTAKYGIAARNPSPLCVPIMMGIPMSMCIQMSNIGVQGDNLNMCMDFLVRLASTELFEMHFQCMKVGLQGASWVGSDGQPVIPANEGKLKDKTTNESEEYYDESEAEQQNEIGMEEQNENDNGMNKQEENLNKAEEETDYNDITEKIRDIVKEQQQQEVMKESVEGSKESEVDDVSSLQADKQEIVQNIMNSINEANTADVQYDNESDEPLPVVMQTEGTKAQPVEETVAENAFEGIETDMETAKNNTIDGSREEEMQNELESVEQKVHDIKEVTLLYPEKQVIDEVAVDSVSTEGLPNNVMVDELHLDSFMEDSETNEMLSNADSTQEPGKDSNGMALTASENHAIEQEENFHNTSSESFSDALDSRANNSLQVLQQAMETSTEHLMTTNLKPTKPQNTATTNSIDTALTAAAIMTTTTTTTKTISKPTTLNETPAATVDKNNNDVNDQNEDNENSDESDGDNSHESDSDYDDEESEESEEEIADKTIESNHAATIVWPPANELNTNTTDNSHKQASTTLQLSNESYSPNDSQANDETTNEEFMTEEFEYEENADEDDQDKSYEQQQNVAEEAYDDKYKDYATTTAAAINDTCCKPALSSASNNTLLYDSNNNGKLPQTENQIDTPSNNNLHSLSNTSSKIMISNTDDSNLLNAKSTTSTRDKVSQIIAGPAATTTTTATSSNVMPLPLARKFISLHNQQQQQPKRYRHSRQRWQFL